MSQPTAHEVKNALRAEALQRAIKRPKSETISKKGRPRGERAVTKWEKRKKKNRRQAKIARLSRRVNRQKVT